MLSKEIKLKIENCSLFLDRNNISKTIKFDSDAIPFFHQNEFFMIEIEG